MNCEEATYQRLFQLWSYNVAHKQLLLRSTKDAGATSRIDIAFSNVSEMLVSTLYHGLTIRETNSDEVGLAHTATELSHGRRVFKMDSKAFSGYVVAGAYQIHEDTKEFYEPSALLQLPGSEG